MAFKQFVIGANTPVTVYKRRAARNLKLTISPNGQVRVSIPAWTPYKAGLAFAESRLPWIESHMPKLTLISDNQPIGKAHRLRFVAAEAGKVTTRIKRNEIIVTHPVELDISHAHVQSKAKDASIRALKAQAESLLPKRLETLAITHGFTYKSVNIKQMTSRWGSCDQSRNITLNLYLMQLPWHLIDYVLLHELTHTKVFKHGPDFWAEMDKHVGSSKALKKELRDYKTTVSGMWHNTNYAV